ncbi:SDR family NAD(P)-dependent oxidoreductase [Acetobacter sp.]|jgi:glucose 1-dehydrogenase|uniref:SDR family NAD(P)-dependent oxidoreductase n=1 Tax=Acetobacter sp. TaxID=440 RepID=UPI0025BF3A99|nr:SDR family oxidoreductase [Acetobacter sp.]MCH4090002.1 SDR family oxidoreductase [Acetobacter sp.]MCI1298698.1 SDR family oxidoreductase [Acetobacter sp.]MCI1315263.1 SDR family oxidoreductase [Acetobacter sp.]
MSSSPYEKQFENRKVFVSGGTQGIGEAIARAFARQGARVAVNGRNRDKLAAFLPTLPAVTSGPHLSCPADVASEEEVISAIDRVFREFGGLDVLVCNAGILSESPSEDVTHDDFMNVMNVNVTGVMFCVREVLKRWLNTGFRGSIVINSSVHQIIPKPAFLAYSASKGAVGNMIRTWGLEYASRGIRINGVAPGAIITPMNDAWVNDPGKYRAVSSHIPMKRPGKADEIAEPVLFLASEKASYITGQTLYVDGGLTLYADFAENWSS